ncbi:hypothetical protein J5X84_25895 [Streptosporangiaceae bacterium NEAU-GS5]|nr:hypothetical protein [Streptosporangiaceae bacterium NEAU-GS5]
MSAPVSAFFASASAGLPGPRALLRTLVWALTGLLALLAAVGGMNSTEHHQRHHVNAAATSQTSVSARHP